MCHHFSLLESNFLHVIPRESQITTPGKFKNRTEFIIISEWFSHLFTRLRIYVHVRISDSIASNIFETYSILNTFFCLIELYDFLWTHTWMANNQIDDSASVKYMQRFSLHALVHSTFFQPLHTINWSIKYLWRYYLLQFSIGHKNPP